MMWLVLACFGLLLAAYQLITRKGITRNGGRLRSAPNRLPLLGHAIKILQPRHELFNWFVQNQRQYGFETLELTVPTLPPGVIITNPANLEFVLKNEALVSKGKFVKDRSRDLFGNGIINSSGELWKAQRKAGLKFFSGNNLEVMVDDVLPEAYSRMRSNLLQHAKAGTVVDMQSVFLDFTSSVMGYMAYDIDLDASHPFTKAFDYASDQIGRRFQNPLYPVTELLFGSKLHDALDEVRRFGRKIVTKAKKQRSIEAFESLVTNNEPVFDTLIDALVESFRDPQIVADSALNFLSAGKDTTAQSFTWTLYALLRNPEELARLRSEIEAFTTRTRKEKSELKLTAADLQPANVPYLMAVYYETLRLYPAIPLEIQECQQDVTLPDGTQLPKDAVVVWCIWAINRAKEIHGEDADSFRPSRWLDEEGKFVNRSPFEFPVFNGGPRSCLGRKMAELMAMFLVVFMLSDFVVFEVSEDSEKPMIKRAQNSLTLPMSGGLSCRIERTEKVDSHHGAD